ncbi:MAG: NAD-dependent epimerase/dehydratase family protein, partial [Gemmatimonadetes bacterium]|nr:NAD-dependent epimerase/dehydratase family protein [Gemmatimonadota bacterium]
LDGAEVAYHLAAAYEIGVVDERAMERANVGGTQAFLGAVEAAGTARAVYVSSTAALGPVPEGEGDEDTRYAPAGRYPSAYHRTKAAAHRLALEAQRRGLPLVIVCPAFVYGPGDHGPGGRFIADLLAGRVPGLLTRPAWFSYVHVDDVAQGLVLAGERGAPGAVYVLSGEHASLNEFAARVARLAGRRPPLLRFPVPLARLTGALLDVVSRATGLRFPITREGVDAVARHRWLHSHERATRELGWRPRPLAEGLPETVEWFARQVRNPGGRADGGGRGGRGAAAG